MTDIPREEEKLKRNYLWLVGLFFLLLGVVSFVPTIYAILWGVEIVFNQYPPTFIAPGIGALFIGFRLIDHSTR